MCGIAGILVRDPERDDEKISCALELMVDRLAHRGPDDAGTARVEIGNGWRLHLGHRRLSILDVSRNGRQPMHDPASGSWISYNGEIYNHAALRSSLQRADFQSSSDTETLLHAWVERGPEVTHELRGMFAFAVYDGYRRQLWLVRDRLGVKPLYVATPAPDLLVFASEVRALLASGMVAPSLSQAGLRSYLAFGAVQAPHTILAGVSSLEPGERVCLDFADAERPRPVYQRYWQPAFGGQPSGENLPTNGHNRGGTDLAGRLRPVFDEAVRSRFLADVPIGVFLSGGIDSSAIVASAARQQLDPKTFSISFDESEYDESEFARSVAEACGVSHTILKVTPDMMLRDLGAALDSYDQPSSDGLNTYTISRAAREAGLKVAISGLGGDEAFAGYPSFRRLASIDRWALPVALPLSSHCRSIAGSLLADSGRLWRAVQLLAFAPTRLDRYSVVRQFYSAERISRLMGTPCDIGGVLPDSVRAQIDRLADATDAINAVSLMELSLYMHNMLLRDTDQMSMAHGLEVRVPLIDHLLVNELAAVRGAAKVAGRHRPNKWLLVEMVREQLPSDAVHRKKMGFVFPWGRWLRNELRGYVDQHLQDGQAVTAAGLDSAEVARLWQRYQQEKCGIRYADILALLNLVHWCQVNEVTM